MTTQEAKRIIKEELIKRDMPFDKLTAKTIDFTDLARDKMIFITVHGLVPDPRYAEIQSIARANGFRIETGIYVKK